MSTNQPTNPHRGSDFTEFMIEEGLMPTPRTDALRLKMAQLGWPSDGEPVAMLMASHGELERELDREKDWHRQSKEAAIRLQRERDKLERELSDARAWSSRLAAKLEDIQQSAADDELGSADFRKCCRYDIPKALAAWKEARHGA